MTPYNRAIFLLNPSKSKDRKGEVFAQICEKYSSRVRIILVLAKTECLVRQIETGMPRLTITNHSELYPEVLNSLNKNASNEMSEYLHDKIRKHAIK